MAGITFTPGQQMVRPGVYVYVQSQSPPPSLAQGVVAAMFAADWGPVAIPTLLNGIDAAPANFGVPSGTSHVDLVQQAFKGGAFQVLAWRLGGAGGGAQATVNINDSAATPILTVTAKYQGTRGNNFRVQTRVNLVDASKRDVVISEGTQILQTVTYTHGSDDAADIVAAFTAAGLASAFVTVTKLATGTGIIAVVAAAALVGGSNPTVNAATYVGAVNGIESLPWNLLVSDVNDDSASTGHANIVMLQGYIDRVRSGDGNRAMLVVAAPTSLSSATRLSQCAALNDEAVVYVFNGLITNDTTPVTLDGYAAGGRVAGMIAASPVSQSLTHQVIRDGASVTGLMTNADYQSAILAGGFAFSMNALNQVQVEYGITTLNALPTGKDAGWKKIRRTRTRDFLVTQIVATWDPMLGNVPNSISGQGAIIGAGMAVINNLITQGALDSGSIILDPSNPPSGDSAWFVVSVVDLDSAEHIYGTFNFKF